MEQWFLNGGPASAFMGSPVVGGREGLGGSI